MTATELVDLVEVSEAQPCFGGGGVRRVGGEQGGDGGGTGEERGLEGRGVGDALLPMHLYQRDWSMFTLRGWVGGGGREAKISGAIRSTKVKHDQRFDGDSHHSAIF
eukprot:324786-Chlamydomonas_euryale.AAC.1